MICRYVFVVLISFLIFSVNANGSEDENMLKRFSDFSENTVGSGVESMSDGFSDLSDGEEVPEDVNVNTHDELLELKSMISKCVGIVEGIKDELSSMHKTIEGIKLSESGEGLKISDSGLEEIEQRLLMLEHKYQQHHGAATIVKKLKDEEELESIREKIKEIDLKDDEMQMITSRLVELERKYANAIDSVNEIKESVTKKELSAVREREPIDTERLNEKKLEEMSQRLKILEKKNDETFDTMDTIKEATAQLRKEVEDQGIETTLLKKEYKKTKKRTNPDVKSIEEQLNVIAEIVVKHDKQLLDIDDDVEIVEAEQEKKLLGDYLYGTSYSESEQTSDSETQEEIVDVDEQASLDTFPSSNTEEKIYDILKDQGYWEIGDGFYAKDVSLMPFGSSVELSGVILSSSGTDYSVAEFKIILYDNQGQLLREQEFSLIGFIGGEAKHFTEIIPGVEIDKIAKYAFVFGSNGEPLQVIDR